MSQDMDPRLHGNVMLGSLSSTFCYLWLTENVDQSCCSALKISPKVTESLKTCEIGGMLMTETKNTQADRYCKQSVFDESLNSGAKQEHALPWHVAQKVADPNGHTQQISSQNHSLAG